MAVPVCGQGAENRHFPSVTVGTGKILPVGGNRVPSACRTVAVTRERENWPASCSHGGMDISAFPGFGPFLDPVALAIVGGGTALAVVLRTPARDLVRGVSALQVLGRKRFDADPLVAQIAALGRIAKRHGVIALDKSVIEDPDMAAAVQLIVDGGDQQQVEALVKHRIAARFERHRAGIELWSGVADIAPAMGMIGTLIGLVQMFTAMKDPAAIGGAMAIALLTTLYGAIVASLIGGPIAARLRRQARGEAQERMRLIEPLAALAVVEPALSRPMREFAA